MFVAAMIGGISTISGELLTRLLVLLGMGMYGVFELNSLILTSDKPSLFMGFVINFTLGSYISSVFYLFFKKLGDGHIVLKCMIGSMLVWFLFELAFTDMIEDHYIPIRPIVDHYVHVLGTMAFGATVGALQRIFLFKRGKQTETS